MLQTSEIYKQLNSSSDTVKRTKIVVDGVEYLEGIQSISRQISLFSGSNISFGGIYSANIDLYFNNNKEIQIPKNSKVEVYTKLVSFDRNTESEWVPQGKYFISKRYVGNPLLNLKCYDALMKTEVTYAPQEGDIGTWPRKMPDVAKEIFDRIGVEIDERTVINGYDVEYPNDMHEREILGYIAAAHCANWCITAEGKARMIRYGETSDVVNVGTGLKVLEPSFVSQPISKLVMYYEENSEDAFVSGDSDDFVVYALCPWATQQMCDDAFNSIKGKLYKPFTTNSVVLDISAEIGDELVINGESYLLANQITNFSSVMLSDISAPCSADAEEEFEYQSPTQLQAYREKKRVDTTIERNTENILLQVSKVEESVTEVASTIESIEQKTDDINENLSGFADQVSKSIDGLQSQIDGQIQTWFNSDIPTTENSPANEWTTDEEKIKHLGDLYYIVENDVSGGQAYRWAIVNGQYTWVLIEDVEVAKALADAAKAQDTADGKRRVFVAQPTPPYDVGDLWAQGESGDLMRCNAARSSGVYNASDWGKASDYTNDDSLHEFVDGEYTGTKTEITKRLSQLDVKTDSISAEVSSATESVTELESIVNGQTATITSYDERIARLELTDGEIAASVEEVRKEVQSSVDSVESEVTELSKRVDLSLTSDQVEIQIQTAINGIDSITTSTGFRFDDEGLFITQSQSSTITTIDSAGFLVTDLSGNPVLTARGNSVEAKDLSATTYLNIGGRSRIENYVTDRSALYWIGG